MDDDKNFKLRQHKNLVKYIDSKLCDLNQYYLLIDEVQYVKNFEPILIKYMRQANVDVYVTGSNSKMLSNDLLSEFRGRATQIRVHPFSFKEYFSYRRDDENTCLNEYLLLGGMPGLINKNGENQWLHH